VVEGGGGEEAQVPSMEQDERTRGDVSSAGELRHRHARGGDITVTFVTTELH
jgi:hypothetical protein